jgi:5-methylcytosine-specific restriction protein A
MPFVVCGNRAKQCLNLVEIGSGRYCTTCLDGGAAKETRPSSHARGYGPRWQKARDAYLDAYPIAVDYFNEHNGRLYPAEEVDHIIPHRGDMKLFWDSTNWQGLTKSDHSRKTAMEDGGFGRMRRK